MTEVYKLCNSCKKELPIDNFGINNANADGHMGMCRVCYNNKARIKYYKNPEYFRAKGRESSKRRREKLGKLGVRDYKLRIMYGSSLEEINNIRSLQKDKCAICGSLCPNDTDHDHVTGKVRGLLCSKCNRGLGYFNDSPGLLLNAVEYLRRNGKDDK